MVDGLQVRRYGAAYRSISPLFTVVARLVSQEMETIRPPELRGAPEVGRRSGPRGALPAQRALDLDDQPRPRHPHGLGRPDPQCRRAERRQDLRLAAVRARQGRLAAAQPVQCRAARRGRSRWAIPISTSAPPTSRRTISSTTAISARRGRSKFARLIAPQVADGLPRARALSGAAWSRRPRRRRPRRRSGRRSAGPCR